MQTEIRNNKLVKRKCIICNTIYNTDRHRLIKYNKGSTCSRKCSYFLRGQKMSIIAKEYKHSLGKTWKVKDTTKIKNKWKDAAYREKQLKSLKEKIWENKEYQKINSETSSRLWKNDEYVKKQIKSRKLTPNKAELSLNFILNNILPDKYRFVGNGEFILAGKCPDFVDNDSNKIIELYGNYWHRHDNPSHRIDLFKKHGYKTLIIWEKELKDLKKLKQNILLFNSL